MVMQSIFPSRPAPTVSYDWIDVINATGYVVFDGFNAVDSTGDKYILFDASQSTSMISSLAETSTVVKGYITNTTFATTGDAGQANKDLDIDFDSSELQLPRIIKGDVIVRFSLGGDDASGAAIDSVYVIAKLRKWNGSSETEIASGQTTTEVSLAKSEEISHTLKINVAAAALIKKGEQIRLTIEVYTQDATAQTMRLAHDPNDSAITDPKGGAGAMSAGNTRLSVAIPFKLDFM